MRVLKGAREKKGMTQKALASELGFTTGQFIHNIEQGRSLLPPIYFKKVANLLGKNKEERKGILEDMVSERAELLVSELKKEVGIK